MRVGVLEMWIRRMGEDKGKLVVWGLGVVRRGVRVVGVCIWGVWWV